MKAGLHFVVATFAARSGVLAISEDYARSHSVSAEVADARCALIAWRRLSPEAQAEWQRRADDVVGVASLVMLELCAEKTGPKSTIADWQILGPSRAGVATITAIDRQEPTLTCSEKAGKRLAGAKVEYGVGRTAHLERNGPGDFSIVFNQNGMVDDFRPEE